MPVNRRHTEDSDNEDLKRIAPTLFGMSRENSFRVPENYFESVPGQVVKQIQSLPDFEAVAKENPFAVPEGYFNSLTISVQKKIAVSENQTRVISIFSKRRLQPVLIAASFTLLLIFGIKYMTRTINITSDASELTVNDITNSGLLAEMDDASIVETFDDQPVSVSADDKDLEDYLLNNNVDVNSIADEL